MAKRKIAALPAPEPPLEPQTPLQFSISVLGGAVATMIVLLFLHFGAGELFSPFAENGGKIYPALAMSGLAAGVGVRTLSRQLDGPQAAAAAALGWGIWGLRLHLQEGGTFLNHLAPGASDPLARAIFFSSAPPQALCVAFGLLVATAAGWYSNRALHRNRAPHGSAPAERKNADANPFRSALTYPILIGIVGLVALLILSPIALPIPEPLPRALPGPIAPAALCGLIVATAMALGGTIARRFFQTVGTAGYVVAPPLVIAFIAALWLQTRGEMTLIRPAALLIWHSSPFEMASWGAFGSALGYYFAREAAKPK